MGVLVTFLKVITKVFNILPLAVQIAELAGKIFRPGEKSGSFKLDVVKQAIRQAIEAAELITAKDLVDEQLLDQGITKIANGTVDVMNAIRPRT